MEVFKSFISYMAYASLGFSFAAAYLKINKLWKRKHIAEVANSVSIMGNVFDIIPSTFFALNFLSMICSDCCHNKGEGAANLGFADNERPGR